VILHILRETICLYSCSSHHLTVVISNKRQKVNSLIKIFAHPYTMVCELYYAGGLGAVWWDEAHIGLYTGIGIQFYFILLFVFLEFFVSFFSICE